MSLEHPSYLDQAPAVKERFQRIYQRPVTLEVKKDFLDQIRDTAVQQADQALESSLLDLA